jgi:hypothetical protein
MRIAIMQPYLFPYLGYFQLMDAADKFLLLDDVNYINRGWVNRNNIMVNDKPYRFTLPLQKVSQHKKINETLIAADEKWKKKFMATLQMAYHQSPFYAEIIELIKEIMTFDDLRLSVFLQNSLEKMAAFIGMKVRIISVGSTETVAGLKGQERILDLCRANKAEEYINLPGGKSLYNPDEFASREIRLSFIEPHFPVYLQTHQQAFVAGLSIIDILMNNSRESVAGMVKDYDIVPG